MPSVEQIVNDIKAILNQIEADSALTAQQAGQIHGDTTAIKDTVASVLATEGAGFANLSQGLATVIDRLNETNSLLGINDAQNRLIICWLEIIAELGCKQLHRLDRQVELQEAIEHAVKRSLAIAELVHGREEIELHREHELRERLELCCPPEPEEPEPCYEACKVDVPRRYKRQIDSFQPLEPPVDRPA